MTYHYSLTVVFCDHYADDATDHINGSNVSNIKDDITHDFGKAI